MLGCNVVSERSQVATRRVRAHFFSYSANRIIEVCLDDLEVTAVAVKAPHEYPESPIEMAQAISVARNSPQLNGKVDGMDAHAILQVRADAFATGASTRCMLVIFTEKNDPTRELPVQYSAMVDLRAQSLMYVAFPCDEPGSPCGKRQAQ